MQRHEQGAAPTLASGLAAPGAAKLRSMRFPIVTGATNMAGATAIVAGRMALVSPPRPRPAVTVPTILEERRRRIPAVVAPVVTIVGIALAMFVVYGPSFVNYDARYALLWARDLWHGFTPEYTADFAPTPHPLATAASSLALPFGNGAPMAMLWITLLSFGALVYLTYRLGAELFSPWVGVVAALVVLTRPAIERDALLGYQDLPFAALVISAVLLEARRPRRGVGVLVLLTLAGLLRPEAWVLAGLYWLYLWPGSSPRDRLRTLALVVAAPLIWAGTDWIIAGDPLHSLHGTADLAEAADRRRDPEDVPFWTAKYFGYALREPMVIGVPLGLAFAWFHARRRAVLPAAVVVAMTAVFAIGPLFGLPLIRRYVETPAVLLTLFYGLAVSGWLLAPAGPHPQPLDGGRGVRGPAVGGLRAVARDQARERRPPRGARRRHVRRPAAGRRGAARARGVRALRSADRRRPPPDPVHPLLARRCARLGPHGRGRGVAGGADVAPAAPQPRHPPRLLAKTFPIVRPPAGYTQIYRNASWRVFAAPGCAA